MGWFDHLLRGGRRQERTSLYDVTVGVVTRSIGLARHQGSAKPDRSSSTASHRELNGSSLNAHVDRCRLDSEADTVAGRKSSSQKRQAVSLAPILLAEDCAVPAPVQTSDDVDKRHSHSEDADVNVSCLADPAWQIAAGHRSDKGSQQNAHVELPAIDSTARPAELPQGLDCAASDVAACGSAAELAEGRPADSSPDSDQAANGTSSPDDILISNQMIVKTGKESHQVQSAITDSLLLTTLPASELSNISNGSQGTTHSPVNDQAEQGADIAGDSQPLCQQVAAGLQVSQVPHKLRAANAAFTAQTAAPVSLQSHAAMSDMSGRRMLSAVCSTPQGNADVHLSPRQQRKAAKRSTRLDESALACAKSKHTTIADAPCPQPKQIARDFQKALEDFQSNTFHLRHEVASSKRDIAQSKQRLEELRLQLRNQEYSEGNANKLLSASKTSEALPITKSSRQQNSNRAKVISKRNIFQMDVSDDDKSIWGPPADLVPPLSTSLANEVLPPPKILPGIKYLTAEKEWQIRAPEHIKDVIASNSRNVSQHGRLLFFQNREWFGYMIDLHTSDLWRAANMDDHLRLHELADAAELYLRILQEVLISELPRVGVTIVTGRGLGVVSDAVQQRLDLLKGSVVNSYQLWQPTQATDNSGALQVTVLPVTRHGMLC